MRLRRDVVETPGDRMAMAHDAGVGRVSIASTFAGTLVAFGATVVLLALAAAIAAGSGLDETLADASWRDAGTAGGLILAGTLFISYLFGGYAAGRMARRSGFSHGLLVFVTSLAGVAIVAAVARMLTDTNTDSILRNLRSVGVPTTSEEWRDVMTVAGIGSLVAMLLGSCIGGAWGERWHNRFLRRALDPTIGTESEIRTTAAEAHEEAAERVDRTRVSGGTRRDGVDLREEKVDTTDKVDERVYDLDDDEKTTAGRRGFLRR